MYPTGTWARPRFWLANDLPGYKALWADQTLRASSQLKGETDICVNGTSQQCNSALRSSVTDPNGHWRGPEACAYMCGLVWRLSSIASYGDWYSHHSHRVLNSHIFCSAIKYIGLSDPSYQSVNRFGFNMAAAFDLVYDYSGFTNKSAVVQKVLLTRLKPLFIWWQLINWSNTVWMNEKPGEPSAVDTDHNIGIAASYFAQAVASYGGIV